MARPRAVVWAKFSQYNKLHTEKVKMWSGVKVTSLFPIKEGEKFYTSIQVWSHLCSTLRIDKSIPLNYEIPVLTDEKTVSFLNEHSWDDYLVEQLNNNQDFIEAFDLLNKLFPDKEKIFFFELEYLVSAYAQGTFIRYDELGNIEPVNDNDLNRQKYYNSKYNEFIESEELNISREKWQSIPQENKELRKKYCGEYVELKQEYAFKNNNLIPQFIELGKNAVCYPVAFSKGTADWHIEKYGKVCAYAHAGEIIFVATPDKVFFEIKRHF